MTRDQDRTLREITVEIDTTAHAGQDFPSRDDAAWLNHTLAWVDGYGAVRLDYRPVHLATLSGDVQTIAPTARKY